MKIAIAIVDDNTQVRRTLSEQIKYSDELEVTLMAKNGTHFLEQVKELPHSHHPKVVLMDIEMPEMNGIQTVAFAKQLYPEMNFLMLTVFDDDEKIFEAIKAGAGGYLLKEEKAGTIIEYIQQLVEMGGAPMSPAIARKSLQLLSKASWQESDNSAGSVNLKEHLSERETDVLKLMIEGKSYKGIASSLFLSTHTVRKHIANIYHKLHVNSKAQVINIAHKQKWFPGD
ncbi:MAG: response regulator transcription factor [Chitinophagaceae bacterium]